MAGFTPLDFLWWNIDQNIIPKTTIPIIVTIHKECAVRSYNTVSSSTQINGLCGYTEPVACVCNYTDYGSYHYSPQCCPSGAQRTGSLSGSTSGACCPTVNKTLRYNCTNYDVTNSASANYYDCYSVGQCAAQFNASGNRTTCYI